MAKDIIHEPVKKAIENDGWTVTHDQYTMAYAEFKVYADLAAERVIAAEKDKEKIAIEIKSFVGRSAVQGIKDALGSYNLYQTLLTKLEPNRKLYLAISAKTYHDIFSLEAVRLIVESLKIPIIVVDLEQKKVVIWKE